MAYRVSQLPLKLGEHLGQYRRASLKTGLSLLRNHTYAIPISQQRRYANGYGGGPQLPGQVAPQPGQSEEAAEKPNGKSGSDKESTWRPTFLKMFESAATTMVSLFVLG